MKKFLDNIELYLGAICSGAMVIILFLQVVSRYVFNNAFSWAEEVAIILFILSTYFGATAAIRTKQHLRLEFLTDKLSEKGKLIMEIVGNFIFALFNLIILNGIVPIVFRLRENDTRYAVTQLPKWIMYAVLPVLFILMVYRLAQVSIENVKKIKAMENNPTMHIANNSVEN